MIEQAQYQIIKALMCGYRGHRKESSLSKIKRLSVYDNMRGVFTRRDILDKMDDNPETRQYIKNFNYHINKKLVRDGYLTKETIYHRNKKGEKTSYFVYKIPLEKKAIQEIYKKFKENGAEDELLASPFITTHILSSLGLSLETKYPFPKHFRLPPSFVRMIIFYNSSAELLETHSLRDKVLRDSRMSMVPFIGPFFILDISYSSGELAKSLRLSLNFILSTRIMRGMDQ